MHCAFYDANHCRSCQWLEKPYPNQLNDKQSILEQLLTEQPVAARLLPVVSSQQAFRNKAKMVVSGSVGRPVLGLMHLEGEEEIALTPAQSLAENFNGVPLSFRPQSFFQTNPQVASVLYATARYWVRALPVNSMWDLFCGVGGFGLHCVTAEIELTGIEFSAEAIKCARRSAEMLGLETVNFAALDSTAFVIGRDAVPQLVLVNLPRHGIGEALVIISARWPRIICSIRAVIRGP